MIHGKLGLNPTRRAEAGKKRTRLKMELRSFIAGLVCGGAAFAVVDVLVLEGSKQTPTLLATSALTAADNDRVSAEPPSEPVGSPAADAATSGTTSQSDTSCNRL
jgi:hypothetical protein